MAMDAVGKEDKDVDNDGKVTKADKYLMARRRAIAKRMKEEVELEEGNYDDMIAAFKAKGGTVKKVAYVEPDEKAKAKLGASWTRGGAGGKGGSAKANAEYSSMNDTTKKYNVKQAANLRKTLGVKEEAELDESDNMRDLAIQAIQSKLKKAKVSYRDPNAKNVREEDKIAKMLAAKNKKK